MNSTSIVINQDLLESATRITGLSSPVEVVEYALREILRQAQKGWLELEGKIQWEGDLEDWRQGRTFDDHSRQQRVD
jgi:Arc/MetJ family transcription regulator